MQFHVGVAQVLQIFEDLPGVLNGAHHNGHIGFLSDFEYPRAEGMEFSVLAGVALGEGAHGYLVLFDELNALEDGLQCLPVVVPIDGLAENLVHESADEGQLVIFLFGQERQLTFAEAVEHDARIRHKQVVAHQQKAPIPGGVFQTLCVNPHPHQLNQRLDVDVHHRPVERAVLLLRLFQVYDSAHNAQKDQCQQKQPQKNPRKQYRQRPKCPVHADKQHTGQDKRRPGDGF